MEKIASRCACSISIPAFHYNAMVDERWVHVCGERANVDTALQLLHLYMSEAQAYQAFCEAPGHLVGAKQGESPNTLMLDFENAPQPVLTSSSWLRDGCICNLCLDPSSKQNTITIKDITDLNIDQATILADGSLQVTWAKNCKQGTAQHISTYDLADLLFALKYGQPRDVDVRPTREIWDARRFQRDAESRNISYDAWMAGGPDFVRAVTDLHKWGLIVLKGVPASDSAANDIASRIDATGPQLTEYGTTWDEVDNVKHDRNSSLLQQDLTWNKVMPRINILHCLETGQPEDVRIFSDGHRAAWDLRYNHPSDYAKLSESKIKHTDREGRFERPLNRPIIGFNGIVRSVNIRWSASTYSSLHGIALPPRFQISYDRRLSQDRTITRRTAFQSFESSLHNARNLIETTMKPGDCVIFDNYRIPHGRRQLDAKSPFSNGRFRGAYIHDQGWHFLW